MDAEREPSARAERLAERARLLAARKRGPAQLALEIKEDAEREKEETEWTNL